MFRTRIVGLGSILVAAVVVVLWSFLASQASAAITYDFNDGTMQGWSTLSASTAAAGYIDLAFAPVQSEHDRTADPGTYFLGETPNTSPNENDNYPVDWANWPNPGCGIHQTLWVESPAFLLNGSADLSYWGSGSPGAINPATGNRDIPLTTIPAVAGNWGPESGNTTGNEGTCAVGLRRDDGTFVLTGHVDGWGNNWAQYGFSAAQLAPYVNDGHAYTLDLVDYLGGTGAWIAIDGVNIPGTSASTWKGTSSNDWGTAANWQPTSPATPGVVLVGTSGARADVSLNSASQIVSNLTFASVVSTTISGSNNLTLDNGASAASIGVNGTHIISAPVALNSSVQVLTPNATDQLTISGAISGGSTAGLLKSGSGTLVLAAENTFSGQTQADGGTLLLANSLALQYSTLRSNRSGGATDALGTLSFGTLTAATFGGLSGDAFIWLTNDVGLVGARETNVGGGPNGQPIVLTVGGNNQDTTFEGTFKGSPTQAALKKVGNGTLTIHPNWYYGSFAKTWVHEGRINQINTPGFNAAGGIQIDSGAVMEFQLTGGTENDVHLGQGLDKDKDGNVLFIPSITGSGTLRLTGAGRQLTLGDDGINVKMDKGGLIDIQGNTLLNGGWASANWQLNKASLNIGAAGTVDLWNGQTVYVDALTGEGTVTTSYSNVVQALNVGVADGSGSFAGTLADGGANAKVALTKSGTGTQTLSGGNIAYSGPTTVEKGKLILQDTTAFHGQGGISVATGATVEFQVGADSTVALGANSPYPVISGGGTLAISGSGVVALGEQGDGPKVSIEMGPGSLIDIQGGTLRNGGWQGGIWDNNKASLHIAAGGQFDLWDGNTVTVDALSGDGLVRDGADLVVGVAGGSGTFAGRLAHHGKLIKLGDGIETLTGADNTNDGGTFVEGGTLVIGNQGALLDGSLLAVGQDAAGIFGASASGAAQLTAAVTPVPEPGTVALLLAAALVTGFGAWRRKTTARRFAV